MRPRRKREQIPVFEGMEPRLLLNGTVLATAVGNTLTITGDQQDNQIAIANVAGAMQVTETGDGKVVNKGTMTGIQNIIIRMRGADDSVVLTSTLNLSGRFMFDGGPGNNRLEDALGVQATGGLTVTGRTTGTAAAGDITIHGGITPATFADGEVTFVQTPATAATGSIVINSILGANPVGAITLHSNLGSAAHNRVTFANLPLDGDIVNVDDGVNTDIDFLAKDDLSDPAVQGEFRIATGGTADENLEATIVNFVNAVNAANGTTPTDLNVRATAPAPGGTQVVLTSTVVGVAGNYTVTPTAGGRITANAVTSGVDPVLVNLLGGATAETLTLKDGVNTVLFTAIPGVPVAGTTNFQIGLDGSETLDNLAAAIAAKTLAGGLTITVAKVLNGGGDTIALTLTNTVKSDAGNATALVPNVVVAPTTPAEWVATQMVGGIADFKVDDSVTLNDGQGHTLTFVGKATLSTPAVATEFQIDPGNSAAQTILNLQTKITDANTAVPPATRGVLEISADNASDIQEVQTLTASAAPTAGKFIINVGAAQTTPLDYNAATGVVDAALEAIPAIGAGMVSVTGGFTSPTNVYTITFDSSLGDVAAMTVTNGTPGLTAGAVAVTVTDGLGPNGNGLSTADADKKLLLTDTWADITTAAASLGIQAVTKSGAQWTVTGMTGGKDASTTNVNDSITLNDGVNPPVTFVAWAPASVVAHMPQFGTAITADQAAINFANAVNGYTNGTDPVSKLLISAVVDPAGSDTVVLTNNLAGAAGNQDITLGFNVTGPAGVTITSPADAKGKEMFGGTDDTKFQNLKANDYVTIDDGVHPAVRFMAVQLAPDGTALTPVLTANEFAIGADAKASAASLQAAIAAFNQATLNVTATLDNVTSVTDGIVNVVNNDAVIHVGHDDGAPGSSPLLAKGHLDGGTAGTFTIAPTADASNGVAMDGTTITLSDGTNVVTFTAKVTPTVPAVPTEFAVGATAAVTATNLINAIQASSLLITATADPDDATKIVLTADNTGTAANVTIVWVGGGVSATGMSEGLGTGVLNAGSLYVYLGNGTPNKRGDSYSGSEEKFNGGGLVNLTDGTITGLLSITGGFGDDQVYLTGVSVGGITSISLGSGADTLSLVGGTYTGAVALNTGTGDDEIAIDGCVFNGAVQVFAGLGDDAILIDPSVQDSTNGVGTKFNRNLMVSTGGGADVITDSTATEYDAPIKGGVVKFIGVKNQGAILNIDGLLLGKHGDKLNPLLAKPLITFLDGAGR
jgi:hypothetical protein